MNPLIIFIKTYKPDFDSLALLLQSIEKYNRDSIPVVLSINDEDYDCFNLHNKQKYTVYKDSDIVSTSIKEGWRYQQIIKSNVYRLKICSNYVCVDSDSIFIRDFYYSDFLYDDKTPYTVMHESKDLQEIAERIGMDADDLFFKKSLRDTRPYFGNKGREYDYGPSPYIWSCKVWEHFNTHFLTRLNMSFDQFFTEIDIKGLSPSECTIYGEYLLRTRLIDIYPIEALFKVYHYEKQYLTEKKLTKKQLSKIYLGIIYQSNWRNAARKTSFWKRWSVVSR